MHVSLIKAKSLAVSLSQPAATRSMSEITCYRDIGLNNLNLCRRGLTNQGNRLYLIPEIIVRYFV
jgi:hypothetical protein